MRVRRCAVLLIESAQRLVFEFSDLLAGGAGARSDNRWLAYAAHLEQPVELDEAQLCALGRVPTAVWSGTDALAAQGCDPATLAALLEQGLLLGDSAEHATLRERDQRVRDAHWHTPSAIAHYASRWSGVQADPDRVPPGFGSIDALIARLGEAPATFGSHPGAEGQVELIRHPGSAIDALLQRRTTCRNFSARPLALADLERILHRVVAAQAVVDAGSAGSIAKKNSPSGGGLHPLEAYLLVQRVDGLAAGIYHYHAGRHVLERLRMCAAGEIADACAGAVAGQAYFAAAPVLLVFTARFRRSFWKYRSHAKAYRSILIELGHVSQNLYISATELDLGAFVTAAINERDIETLLMLDPLEEGPLAVCGLGHRAQARQTVELDPLGAVWPHTESTES